MGTWTKYPEDRILVGRDWTIDLDGASISSAPEPVTADGSELAMEFVETEGNVTKYWLSGGRAGRSSKVVVLINTSEGEILSDHIPVRVSR